ncbi:MAG: T9SS type A sorting domain-containing protein [Bacteroidota bacterium]
MNKSILALLMLPTLLLAQSSVPTQTDILYNAVKVSENSVATASFNRINIPVAGRRTVTEAVQQYYEQHHPALQSSETSIRLLHAKHTVLGWHLYYEQLYKGIPITGATLKVNINDAGTTLSVFDKLELTQNWKAVLVAPNASFGKGMWLVVDGQPVAVYRRSEGGKRIMTDDNGIVFSEKDGRLYFAGDDTLVTAKVFLPDPITPIGVIAGLNGTYKHFNDSDYALLNNQLVEVSFPVTFDGSLFQLRNKYARIYDTSFKTPNISPAISVTPQFNFTRKQNGFKDVMALYHVTNTQEYLHALGIDEVKYQLKIDAHATTSDQSYFEYDGDTALNFGTGGVPDAEDADVIVHEFTHAVSFSINPNLNMSPERRAIEEGLCDVMAAIYSKKYTLFNWRRIFNWDAPNPFATGVTPFWNGRNGNSTKTYANLTNDSYASSEIWSSTLLDIAEQIGSDSTIILMLASVASYTDNTTMPQAATLFMQVDSILLNKHFSWKMGTIFNNRLLGNFPTGMDEQTILSQQLRLNNSLAFALGDGDALLNLPLKADVVVYDLQGRKHSAVAQCEGELLIRTKDFVPGLYIVRVYTRSAQVSLKLLKN